MDLKGVLGKSIWYISSLVFLVSFMIKLILDFIFQSRFGWHAVNHAETWFYTGVMQGTHLPTHGLKDPTVWFLRGVGGLFPGESALYGVFFSAAFLSAITSVMITLILYELYGRKTGLVGGLIYAGMIEPLALALSGFTHDHIQLPVILATMLFAIKAVKDTRVVWKVVWVVAFATLTYLAYFINEVIYVGVGITAVYVTYQVLQALPKTIEILAKRARKSKNKRLAKRLSNKAKVLTPLFQNHLYKVYITSAIACLVIAHISGISTTYLSEKLEDLPQGRMGSADVLPLNLLTFWLRYNILLFLLPFGFIAAYHRRDTYAMMFTVIGLMIASVMDRGTRISDIGFAMLFAYAIVDWDMKLGKYSDAKWIKNPKDWGQLFKVSGKIIGLAGQNLFNPIWNLRFWYSKKLRLFTTITFSIFTCVYMALATNNRVEYTAIFLIGGATMLFILWLLKNDTRILSVTAVIIILGMLVNIIYITYALEPRKIISDAEYRVLNWLSDNKKEGRILAGWDRGYMLEVITGLEAISSPGRIDARLHDALWVPDRQAASRLRKGGVRYVLMNSENFNVVKVGGDIAYRITGGLLLNPKSNPPMEFTNRLTAYKLRQKIENPYFKLIREDMDPVSGVHVFLYEIVLELSQDDLDYSYIGAIGVNYGGSRTAVINASIESGGRTYSLLVNQSFKENDVKELVFSVRPHLDDFNCSIDASPLDESWGYVGIITYLNQLGERDEEIQIVLLDGNTKEQVDVYSKIIHFDAGQKKTIQYSFEIDDSDREYIMGTNAIDGLSVVREESGNPKLEGIGFLATFC